MREKAQVTPLQAMIQAVAAKLAPITYGVKIPAQTRKQRKRKLYRIQRRNARRLAAEKNRPAVRKYMKLRNPQLSRRGLDGTMRR